VKAAPAKVKGITLWGNRLLARPTPTHLFAGWMVACAALVVAPKSVLGGLGFFAAFGLPLLIAKVVADRADYHPRQLALLMFRHLKILIFLAAPCLIFDKGDPWLYLFPPLPSR
jgi:hypothetical protein